MVLSLNGEDPSCMNSITGSTGRAKYSNILNDKRSYPSIKMLVMIRRKSKVARVA